MDVELHTVDTGTNSSARRQSTSIMVHVPGQSDPWKTRVKLCHCVVSDSESGVAGVDRGYHQSHTLSNVKKLTKL